MTDDDDAKLREMAEKALKHHAKLMTYPPPEPGYATISVWLTSAAHLLAKAFLLKSRQLEVAKDALKLFTVYRPRETAGYTEMAINEAYAMEAHKALNIMTAMENEK